MIDSQGRTSADLPTTTEACSNSTEDHYTFVDETFAIAHKNIDLKLPCKRGVKRTFEDIIKSDPYDDNSRTISGIPEKSMCGDTLSTTSPFKIPRNDLETSAIVTTNFENSFPDPCVEAGLTSNRIDSNNNNNSSVGSLRSSSLNPVDEMGCSVNQSTVSGTGRGSSRRGRSYGLRPRANLRRSVDDKDSPERPGRKVTRRGRARGHTLSKYRRNTANARERDRMREINSAFATLRGALPSFACRRIASMTKITTLKLATSYIRALADLLKDPPVEPQPNVQYLTSQLSSPSTSSTVLPQTGNLVPSLGQNHPCVSASYNIDGRSAVTANIGCYDGRVEGRVEGRWWSAVESDVLQGLDSEIAWDDLTLPDMCWGMS